MWLFSSTGRGILRERFEIMREIVLKKLRIRILEYYDTQRNFAEALGISQNLLTYRLQGRTQFRPKEIYKVCQMLEIPQEEIADYFFDFNEN